MEDDGQPLRRRVPGEARSAPASSGRPVLSQSVLLRMQAAVDAARAEAASQDDAPTGPLARVTGAPSADEISSENGSKERADRGRGKRPEPKRSHPAVPSVIRRRRRAEEPASGTASVEPATANGTGAATGADTGRPELPPLDLPTVPTYGPAAEAQMLSSGPDVLPRRSRAHPAAETPPTAEALPAAEPAADRLPGLPRPRPHRLPRHVSRPPHQPRPSGTRRPSGRNAQTGSSAQPRAAAHPASTACRATPERERGEGSRRTSWRAGTHLRRRRPSRHRRPLLVRAAGEAVGVPSGCSSPLAPSSWSRPQRQQRSSCTARPVRTVRGRLKAACSDTRQPIGRSPRSGSATSSAPARWSPAMRRCAPCSRRTGSRPVTSACLSAHRRIPGARLSSWRRQPFAACSAPAWALRRPLRSCRPSAPAARSSGSGWSPRTAPRPIGGTLANGPGDPEADRSRIAGQRRADQHAPACA